MYLYKSTTSSYPCMIWLDKWSGAATKQESLRLSLRLFLWPHLCSRRSAAIKKPPSASRSKAFLLCSALPLRSGEIRRSESILFPLQSKTRVFRLGFFRFRRGGKAYLVKTPALIKLDEITYHLSYH